MPSTADVIREMLTENTGRSILDSGDYYGRHWQQNQERDFDAEPAYVLSFDGGYISYTKNLYHLLTEQLTFNEELQERYDAFIEEECDRHSAHLQDMGRFIARLKDEACDRGAAFGGFYGEGDPIIHNTYNEEECISQTLQFIAWEDDDGAHLLLQIHGGCDVRGGYTSPKAFDVDGYEGVVDFFMALKDCHIGAVDADGECVGLTFTSDDAGVNWYEDGACGAGYMNLYNFSIVTLEDLETPTGVVDALHFHLLAEDDTIVVDPEGNGWILWDDEPVKLVA